MYGGFLLVAIAGLVLVEQIMRNAHVESRRAVKYLCIGLGVIFAYDFYLYSNALLFQGLDITLWEARGFVNGLAVPVLAIAIARDPRLSLDIFVSRRMVFHTTALPVRDLFCTLYHWHTSSQHCIVLEHLPLLLKHKKH